VLYRIQLGLAPRILTLTAVSAREKDLEFDAHKVRRGWWQSMGMGTAKPVPSRRKREN